MEPLEAVRQVVEERALDVDHVGEDVGEPLRVIARVGVRALGEEDLDLGPGRLRSLAAANAADATSSALKPASAARRIISATIPARASAPRRCGGRWRRGCRRRGDS